jgi:hypothetical protein
MEAAPEFWVRVKPYNQKKGFLVKRTRVLGRLWKGGEGLLPNDIPEWVGVSQEQAEVLSYFHQTDGDDSTPKLFDIVTDAQRQRIDQGEMEQRMIALRVTPQGLGSLTLDKIQGRYSDVSTGIQRAMRPYIGRMTLADLAKAPSVSKDEKAQSNFLSNLPQQVQQAALPKEVDISQVDTPGRMEAISGFEQENDGGGPPSSEHAQTGTAGTLDARGMPPMPTARAAGLPPIKSQAEALKGVTPGKTTKKATRKKGSRKAKK